MADDGEALLSPELAGELAGAGGAAMLTGAKKKQTPGGGGGGTKHGPRRGNAAPVEKKLSKSQKRKLAKIEEDKRKREARAGVVARLNAAKLVSDDALTLLHGSDRMGQRMSKRETLRRELKAERAGIALPDVTDSRLTKREARPSASAGDATRPGDDSSASSDASDSDASERETFGRKQSWPINKTLNVTAKKTQETYGPIHPLDKARLDAERIAAAERAALDDPADAARASATTNDERSAADPRADRENREAFAAALAAARALSARVRASDPAQAAEAAVEALGPYASMAALDPRDARARLLAANEAAAARASAAFPGVFVGASHAVRVDRDPEIQAARSELPILGAEHEIVETIDANPVTIVCGETGCGKTTQVPQFLFEAGYGDRACAAHPGAIAVTQPRRVAVTATATRVASELGLPLGGEVGYQVRYDKRVGDAPRIKFLTDGVLLREIQSDLLLRKYSAVIVDEAHERSVNTDILLGLLSRVVPLRAQLAMEGLEGVTPLRLVVMSATLRVEEFANNARLCPAGPPALLKVAARQFPVTTHFARETTHGDYVGAAKKKVLAIHRKLPPGGVLVFLTGQREVDATVEKLRKAFPRAGEEERGRESSSPRARDDETSPRERETLDSFDADAADAAGEEDEEDEEDDDLEADGDRDDFDANDSDADAESDVSEEDDVVVNAGEGVGPEEAAEAEAAWVRAHAPTTTLAGAKKKKKRRAPEGAEGEAAAAEEEEEEEEEDSGPGPLHVLPLYAMLPAAAQRRVFDPPPPGSRLVIVATNVAETSLTIPGVRYVVDCGREKRRIHGGGGGGDGADGSASLAAAGLSRFAVDWVSRASADQRAGRAGRTGPGHCYRLFSSAHFENEMRPHAAPAILGAPVEGVALRLRAMGVDRVARFPFITPPDEAALRRALLTLRTLGAIEHGEHGGDPANDADPGVLTPLGRRMAALPIAPRHARMLLAAAEATARATGNRGCLAAAVAVAATLSLDSPFLSKDAADRAAIASGAEGEEGAPESEEARALRRKRMHAFHHPRGDALSAAKALVAYDRRAPRGVRNGAKLADRFCRDHGLHAKTMREASDLRAQLTRVLLADPPAGSFLGGAERKAEGSLSASAARELEAARSATTFRRGARTKDGPPSDPAALALTGEGPGDVALRRALLVGWADRVARRVRASDAAIPGDDLDASSRSSGSKATRYLPALLDRSVYLHPSSSLGKAAPEYVLYADLIQTEKRPYLAGATSIDAAWLATDARALVRLSAPLDDPAPRYAPAKDAVVAFRAATFGRHRWRLPLVASVAGAECPGSCEAFAVALLDGRVSRAMATLADRLAAKPATCAKPEGKAQRRVADLTHALRKRRVASLVALGDAWRRDPAWLMAEVRAWMKRGHEHALERIWPNVVAGAGEGERGGDGDGDGDADADGDGDGETRAEKVATPTQTTRDAKRAKRDGAAKGGAKKKAKRSVARNAKALDAGVSIWD